MLGLKLNHVSKRGHCFWHKTLHHIRTHTYTVNPIIHIFRFFVFCRDLMYVDFITYTRIHAHRTMQDMDNSITWNCYDLTKTNENKVKPCLCHSWHILLMSLSVKDITLNSIGFRTWINNYIQQQDVITYSCPYFNRRWSESIDE